VPVLAEYLGSTTPTTKLATSEEYRSVSAVIRYRVPVWGVFGVGTGVCNEGATQRLLLEDVVVEVALG